MKLLAHRDGVPLFIAIASASALLRLAFIWTGSAEGALVSDDAYYYFTIARNVATGHGVTFDGLSPTNGFHPLWMLVLVPVFKLFGADLWTPVRVAGSLCVGLDLISAWVIFGLFRSRGMIREATIATAAWLLCPFTVLLGMRCMEASLSTMLVLVTFAYVLRNGLSIRSAVVGGALIGITGLARVDNLIPVGIAAAMLALFASETHRSARARAAWVIGAAVTALIVAAPWLVWNQANFASIVPVSGQVKFQRPDIFGALPLNWNGIIPTVKSLIYQLFAPIVISSRYITGEEFMPARYSPVVGAGFLILLLIPVIASRTKILASFFSRNIAVFVGTYAAVHVLLFGFIWRAYMSWYALPFFALATVFAGMLIPSMKRARLAGALFIVVSLLAYGLFLKRLPHRSGGELAQYEERIEAVAQQSTGVSILGVYDAGAVGYVATKYPAVTVTNLDGLVNNAAYHAVQEGTFPEYILETVDVLFEPPSWALMYIDSTQVGALATHFQKHDKLDLWFKRPWK